MSTEVGGAGRSVPPVQPAIAGTASAGGTDAPTASGVRQLLVPATIGIYSLYSARSVLTGPYERWFFGFVVLAAAIAAMGTRRGSVPRGLGALAGAWIAATALYLAASLLQVVWSPTYVVGDLLLALLPLLMLLGFLADDNPLSRRAPLLLLMAVMTLAAIEAQISGTMLHRHDPPSPFLIAGAWYFALAGRQPRHRALGCALVGLTAYLTYTSGYRTHVILWLIAPVLILYVLRGLRGVAFGFAALVVLVSSLSLAGHPLDLGQAVQDTRFSTVVQGSQDVSVDTRLSEVKDVLRTTRVEWLPGEAVVGYGFGASYLPHFSDIRRDIGADGRVHNIHIGPVLVFFRYGILGLLIFASLIAFALRMLVAVRAGQHSHVDRDTQAVMSFALILFLIEFLTLNASVEPLMSYCLAGLIVIRLSGRRPATTPEGRGSPPT